MLEKTDFARLIQRSVEQAVGEDNSIVCCPSPDCPNQVWLGEGDLPRLVCEVCWEESCVRCGASPFHFGLSCEEEVRRHELGRAVVPRIVDRIEEALRDALFRQCPGCQVACAIRI